MLSKAVLCTVAFLSVLCLNDLSIKYVHIADTMAVGMKEIPNANIMSFIFFIN